MTILVAVTLALLTGLGAWQLQRATEMRAYQSRFFDRLGMAAQPPPEAFDHADFLRVKLLGEYLPDEHYLVDNRVQDGTPGYWVVTRFRSANGRVYLVNRGWLPAPPERETLPAVSTPQGRQRLVGVVWPDTGLPPLLAADPWPDAWPKRVQRLNVSRMARDGAAVVPREVRLEAGQPGALTPVRLDAPFSPERHQGYAVQWFALAAALGVACVVFGYRRGRET